MKTAPILVVDDDPDIRETIIEALGDEGIAAIGAADGREALDLLHSGTRPAVILLDLMMPGMSGADFLLAQRAAPALAAIPVVLLSADANVGTKAASLDATEFLRKPIKLELLIATALRYAQASIDPNSPRTEG